MPSGLISKRTVDALHAGKADVFLWDRDLKGFGVKITPAGVRTYVFQYRLGGRSAKARRVAVGRHGSITPDQARELAKALAFKVHQGIDPVQEEKDRARRAATMSFEAYVETFSEGYLETEWGDSWPQAKRQLVMHVVPQLKDKALPDITVSDLNPVFDALRSQPALQRNVHAVLRKLFNWADKRDDIAFSPMGKMDVPRGAKRRKRILSPDELAAIWQASFKQSSPRGEFIRALILTLQRRSELADLPWTELNKDARQWRLPGERAKNGQDHIVPLNDLAMGIFEGLGWKSRGLVFPSSTGKTAISNFSDMKAALDRDMQAIVQRLADERAEALGEPKHTVVVEPWRLHDIRRTGTTQMATQSRVKHGLTF